MTKFPILSDKKVVAVLLKAGFVEHFKVGGHRMFKHPKTLHKTEVPMHNRDIKRGLLRRIIKQSGLTEEEFLNYL